MSHTYVQNLVHVVFSTKERRKLIPQDHRTKLWAFMAGVCSKEKILPHEIGGMDRSRSFADPTAANVVIVGCRPGDQNQLVPMDGEEFCPAARLCRLQRERVKQGCRGSLHPHTGYSSQEDGLQIRIDRALGETRRVLRPEICS